MNEVNRGKQQEARSTLACSRDLSAHDTAQGIAVRVANLGIRLPLGRGASRLWGQHHWALRGVNFEVQRGEAVGVLGRNGSGKSTLLRAIAGVIAPDEGAIGVAPDLSAAILSPGAGFQPHLTGRENLYNSALYQGYLPKTVASKLHDIVEFAGIGAWIEQPVATYSAGMRVRLGFSLALHLPTDILMIDETLSAGDAAFRAKAKQLIDQLISNDRTVILVSHNIETLRATCKRGVVLDRGRQITVCDIGEAIETNQSILLGHGTLSRAGGPSRSEVEEIAYELRLAQEQLVALQDEATMQAQVVHCVTEDYIAALEQVVQFDDPFSEPGDYLARPSSEVAHATQTAEQAYTQMLDKKAGRVQAIIEEERVTAKLADLRERIAVLQEQLKEP